MARAVVAVLLAACALSSAFVAPRARWAAPSARGVAGEGYQDVGDISLEQWDECDVADDSTDARAAFAECDKGLNIAELDAEIKAAAEAARQAEARIAAEMLAASQQAAAADATRNAQRGASLFGGIM